MTDRNGWTMLVIPAIATEDETYRIGPAAHDVHHRRKNEVLLPDREPKTVLDEIRIAIGSMNFAAQYQQAPVPPDGNVIRRDWLRFYTAEPEDFDRLVLSWDTASTLEERSSYSVGQLWGVKGSDFYLLENIRERFEAPRLNREIIASMQNWEPDATIIENTELGRAMAQQIRDTTNLRPLLATPTADKTARLLAVSPRYEAGQVHLPKAKPWLDVYLTELLGFPRETFDDQVDATSLALNYIVRQNARTRPLNSPIVGDH